MSTLEKPLTELTAVDLMSRHVVVIPDEMALQDAAHLLARENIHGAPVVDARGHCVGVLSATDFFRWVEDDDLEIQPSYEVSTLMTRDPVTVPPDAPLRDLVHIMIDGHIQRVIVVDGERRPVGVVSSTDVIAALMNTMDQEHGLPLTEGQEAAGHSPQEQDGSNGEGSQPVNRLAAYSIYVG